jgi:hypothetical protein
MLTNHFSKWPYSGRIPQPMCVLSCNLSVPDSTKWLLIVFLCVNLHVPDCFRTFCLLGYLNLIFSRLFLNFFAYFSISCLTHHFGQSLPLPIADLTLPTYCIANPLCVYWLNRWYLLPYKSFSLLCCAVLLKPLVFQSQPGLCPYLKMCVQLVFIE